MTSLDECCLEELLTNISDSSQAANQDFIQDFSTEAFLTEDYNVLGLDVPMADPCDVSIALNNACFLSNEDFSKDDF